MDLKFKSGVVIWCRATLWSLHCGFVGVSKEIILVLSRNDKSLNMDELLTRKEVDLVDSGMSFILGEIECEKFDDDVAKCVAWMRVGCGDFDDLVGGGEV